MAQAKSQTRSLGTSLPFILIVVGLVGCVASFALTYDKIHVLQGIGYQPSCNINPILSCGSVMNTDQASLLGVPNSIFRLVSFTALTTYGVVIAAGAQVKRWVWLLAQYASSAGVVFMHYLFFQGVYKINAICPWCFAVWIITIPAFWYITLYNLQEKNIRLPSRLNPAVLFVQRHHGDILLAWYLVILGIILQHFWYYWSTLIWFLD